MKARPCVDLCVFFALSAMTAIFTLACGDSAVEDASSIAAKVSTTAQKAVSEPVYVVIMNHVEGDPSCEVNDLRCLKSLNYQRGILPPPRKIAGPSYALDIAGTDLIYRTLQNYADSGGRKPKLFIEPAGEWWQTFADPLYGGKIFNTFDYLSLGNEFGIQAHSVFYSDIDFGWYKSPQTEQGVADKFEDVNFFAERSSFDGRPVSGGRTFTGGWKNERTGLGDAYTEYVIDHAAYALGYRISFEDHDGHMQNEPFGVNNYRAVPFVYRADYGDGVSMVKIDMNGSVTTRCEGNTPRCETPAEAAARFDRTLEARMRDQDSRKVYFFGYLIHAGEVWNDFNITGPGQPLMGEGLGLTSIMNHIQSRIKAGVRVKFVTPSELASIFETRNTTPSYFLAVHNEPLLNGFPASYDALKRLIAKANEYNMKLTLMFTPPWANFITSDPSRSAELESWKKQGHEIAGHHHTVRHPGTWDGYTYMPAADAKAIRSGMGKHEPYLGNLTDYLSTLSQLEPNIHSGCMNDEKDKNEMPSAIVYDTCSGYANFGAARSVLPETATEKGRNDYVLKGTVNGVLRKWLTHAQVMSNDQAAAAGRFFANMTWGVYGAVTHSESAQVDAIMQFMDFLHEKDPLGEHSKTVSEIIGSGLLPEKAISP